MTNEIQKTQTGGTLALEKDVAQGCVVEGMTNEDIILPRLHVYQGTTTEQEKYPGDFKRGDLLNSMTIEPVEKGCIVPITGFKSWMRWEKGAKYPEYVFRDVKDVPPADLQWSGTGASRIPPAAMECWNFAVLVEGQPGPFMCVFKKTSMKAGQLLGNLERARGALGKGPGRYELTITPDKNPAGQSYMRVGIKAAGDPSEEMRPLIEAAFVQLKGATVKAHDEDAEATGDGIPI